MFYMSKKLFLLYILFLSCIGIQAAPVNENQALVIARKYLSGRDISKLDMCKKSVSSEKEEMVEYYMFNASDNKGYVIVSGEDGLTEIVGYSMSGNIDMENMPVNLKAWLDGYAEYVRNVRQNRLLAQKETVVPGTPVKGPLLTSKWDQQEPYGDLLPTFEMGGNKYRYVTGCTATAMAQLMNYHEHPAKGMGRYAYSFTNNVGDKLEFDVDFSQSVYDWDNMIDDYTGNYSDVQSKAVAKLMYDCGVSINSYYNAGVTGAMDSNVPNALAKYFGYDAAHYLREAFTTEEFMTFIKSEIDGGFPMMFGGAGASNEGHAFVVDGYDSNDFLHINWGWSGRSDGYFNVNYMNPSDLGTGAGMGSYIYQQTLTTAHPVDGQGTCGQMYLRYNGGALKKSPMTADEVDKGSTIILFAYGLYNPCALKYNGDIALAVYDESGKRFIVAESGKRSVTAEAGEYVGGKYGAQNVRISSELSELSDGKYSLVVVSRQQTYSEWVPVSVRHTFNIEIKGNKVALNGMSDNVLQVQGPIIASTDQFYSGSKVGFKVTLFNPCHVAADGKLGIKIMQGDVQKASAQAPVIVYDNQTYEATYLLELKETSFPVGETFTFVIDTLINSENMTNAEFTLDLNGVTPFEFTVTEASGVSSVYEPAVSVYPNPVVNELCINASDEIKGIRLYAADGHAVKVLEKVGNNQVFVDLSECNEGYYIVDIELLDGKSVRKQVLKLP